MGDERDKMITIMKAVFAAGLGNRFTFQCNCLAVRILWFILLAQRTFTSICPQNGHVIDEIQS